MRSSVQLSATAGSLQLGPYRDRRPGQLSDGQRQSIAIDRSIVRDPDVFLFHELLSNRDAELWVKIARLHKRLDARMVYVAHDQVEAVTLADKNVVLPGQSDRADRQHAASLRGPEPPVSRRLHRQSADELPARSRRGTGGWDGDAGAGRLCDSSADGADWTTDRKRRRHVRHPIRPSLDGIRHRHRHRHRDAGRV